MLAARLATVTRKLIALKGTLLKGTLSQNWLRLLKYTTIGNVNKDTDGEEIELRSEFQCRCCFNSLTRKAATSSLQKWSSSKNKVTKFTDFWNIYLWQRILETISRNFLSPGVLFTALSPVFCPIAHLSSLQWSLWSLQKTWSNDYKYLFGCGR